MALGVYGIFGSPTPDNFGAAEWITGVLLVLSLEPRFERLSAAEALFLVYGLTIPVAGALIRFQPPLEMFRDVVPFIFLLMPVLYNWRGLKDARSLSLGIAFIGWAFSFRSLWSYGADIFNPDAWLGTAPDLLYLANSPEVLFSAIFLLGLCFGRDTKLEQRILYFVLAICPLLAMATLVQRASAFYIVLTAVLSFAALLNKNPVRAILAGLFMLIVCWPFHDFLNEIFKQLAFKNQVVGLNSRGAEWQAVIHEVYKSPETFLFGLGWGSGLENPAVGGLRVNFTHSLLSSLLLKTGLTGVILFFVYAAYLFRISIWRRPWRRLPGDILYLCALAGPLLIGVGLYASYKSLGYGLLLLLLTSFAEGKKLDAVKPAVA